LLEELLHWEGMSHRLHGGLEGAWGPGDKLNRIGGEIWVKQQMRNLGLIADNPMPKIK
jgi:hypothetical protein